MLRCITCPNVYTILRSYFRKYHVSETDLRIGFVATRNRSRRPTTRQVLEVDGSLPSRKFQDNIILIGSPGAGKTTVGRILASQLGRPVLDMDNDHLEKYWDMPVSKKLAELGPIEFLKAEGEATLDFEAEGHVVSLTGSNPMHIPAMEYLQTIGTIVFLDVPNNDIVARLAEMEVNRIVGHAEHATLFDTLCNRQRYYENCYDIRIICEKGETPESIASKVENGIDKINTPKSYVSTRGHCDNTKTFSDVILEGLAPDGGLYLPEISATPKLTLKQWECMVHMNYTDRALRVLEPWIHPGDLDPQTLSKMLQSAYGINHFNCHKVFPVVKLAEGQYLQELFHGPTASFKDAALQLMPRLFSQALDSKAPKSYTKYLILVATSGDTGSAVLDGFSKITDTGSVDMVVLYPKHGISRIQEAQMTTAVGDNVHVIGVSSDFDFCQASIKEVFANKTFAAKLLEQFNVQLSAANSINWGRLLPQIVYHASAYLDLVRHGVLELGQKADLCIPTGNFGNILAGYYSKLMGIPWRRLICASNENNVLTDFIRTGHYDLSSRHVKLTSSPAIDILKSSNLERYLYHITGGDAPKVRGWYEELDRTGTFFVGDENLTKIKDTFSADWCSSEDCRQTIAKTWEQYEYLLDPHTAVAKAVADRLRDPNIPIVISATAHYAKFAHDVLPVVDGLAESSEHTVSDPLSLIYALDDIKPNPPAHSALTTSLHRPRRHHKVCAASVEAIMQEVEFFLTKRHKSNTIK